MEDANHSPTEHRQGMKLTGRDSGGRGPQSYRASARYVTHRERQWRTRTTVLQSIGKVCNSQGETVEDADHCVTEHRQGM